jgi:hypothetical protein
MRVQVPPPGPRLAKAGLRGSVVAALLSKSDLHQSRHNAASCDPLNPLAPPGRRLEGIREILGLVHDLTVAELQNAHGVLIWSLLFSN